MRCFRTRAARERKASEEMRAVLLWDDPEQSRSRRGRRKNIEVQKRKAGSMTGDEGVTSIPMTLDVGAMFMPGDDRIDEQSDGD